MAYGQGWDASAPDGAITPAADIDAEIQDTKVAVGERLVEFVPEWADDLKQPKKISIVSGAHADRPATPDFQGEMWFSIDTQILYIADATPEWKSTGGIAVEDGDPEAPPSTTLYIYAKLAGLGTIPATNSWTLLGGWEDVLQYGTFYIPITFPFRFYLNTAGTYKIDSAFVIDPNGSATHVDYGVNGADPTGTARGIVDGAAGTPSFNKIQTFSAGDYIEFYAKCAGGGSASVYTNSHIAIHRLP